MPRRPPLNPDALANLRLLADKGSHELRHVVLEPDLLHKLLDIAEAAALPEVTTVEGLDALPVGTVILSETYQYSLATLNYPVSFQKLYTKEWHRGGRSAETHPDNILPARVLYRPEVEE